MLGNLRLGGGVLREMRTGEEMSKQSRDRSINSRRVVSIRRKTNANVSEWVVIVHVRVHLSSVMLNMCGLVLDMSVLDWVLGLGVVLCLGMGVSMSMGVVLNLLGSGLHVLLVLVGLRLIGLDGEWRLLVLHDVAGVSTNHLPHQVLLMHHLRGELHRHGHLDGHLHLHLHLRGDGGSSCETDQIKGSMNRTYREAS